MAVCLFLFFLHFLSSAHAAIIPSPPSTPSFFNLTLANQISLNGSTVVEYWSSYCTPIRRWNEPRMQQDDCEAVLQYFYHETMTDGGRKPIEFRSPGSTRTTHMKVQKTPRKYTFGTCTLAIIIVSDFPIPEMLPGGYRTGPPTDQSTYLDLNRVAANLVEICVLGRSEAGWQMTGHHDGIGVFVWSTNSEEDKEIEGEKARFAFSGLGMAGNGSAVTS